MSKCSEDEIVVRKTKIVINWDAPVHLTKALLDVFVDDWVERHGEASLRRILGDNAKVLIKRVSVEVPDEPRD